MNEETKRKMQENDEQYLWHSMKPYQPASTMVVKEANGAWVTDIDGNSYLDAMAGLWCVNIGYGRRELAEAAYEQLKDMAYYPLTQSHLPAIQLAEKINQLLGGDYVIFFSNSGSEANEVAFKVARQFHEQNGNFHRYKFISRYRAYHGNTLGALAATGQAQRKFKYEPLAPGFIHVAPPDSYRNPEDAIIATELPSVQAIENVMTWELSETIAGVIMEPIITGGGILIPSEKYLTGVKQVCERHGALLIVDEVICGFGRTGEMFGFMHSPIKPDIITMAKGLTSGYLPLSATAVKREIYESFRGSEQYDYFRHVNTFGGSPASCALALKNLEILEKEHLVERSKTIGLQMLKRLQEQLDHHPNVGDIRGKGLLIGVEMVEDKQSKKPIDLAKVNHIINNCKKNGLIIGKNGATVAGYNNVLTISPPLNITEEDMHYIVNTLTTAIIEEC